VSAKRSRPRRCSPTDALNLLIPAFEPMEAAAKLTQAIHEGARLYCDGVVVPAHFRKRLMVVARLDPDGRWTAEIVSAVREAWEKPFYQWEFETERVTALLQPDTKAEAVQAAAASAAQAAEASATSAAEAKAARTEAEQARSELERARAEMQAATERMEMAEARVNAAEARVEATINNSQRRKPGPKPDYPLWRLQAAAFALDCLEKKKRKPLARDVAEHLQNKCNGWAPDESEIGRLMRDLLR